MNIEERLRAKVEQVPDGCWKWHGARDRHGYGQVRVNKHHCVLAHRLAWELKNGPIPEGMCVLHRCDNPECTYPEHLFLGTMKDNSRDMIQKGRGHGQFTLGCAGNMKVFCWRGHQKEPGQDCRICHHIAHAAYKRRLMEARAARTCIICGLPFPAKGKRIYCSQRCKWTASNRKHQNTRKRPSDWDEIKGVLE